MEQKKEETVIQRLYRYAGYAAMVVYVGAVVIYPAILNERSMAEAAKTKENLNKSSCESKHEKV